MITDWVSTSTPACLQPGTRCLRHLVWSHPACCSQMMAALSLVPACSNATAASCSIQIERKNRAQASSDVISLAEVRLFNRLAAQIPTAGLVPWMSSAHPSFPAQNCFDATTNTSCHTAIDGGGDADPLLRVRYPCSEGLSRVEVVNRQNFGQSRITAFQLRFLNATGASSTPPYHFNSVQSLYLISLQSGELMGCDLVVATGIADSHYQCMPGMSGAAVAA